MTCPRCNAADLEPVDATDLSRCPNCQYTLSTENTSAPRKASSAKETAKKRTGAKKAAKRK